MQEIVHAYPTYDVYLFANALDFGFALDVKTKASSTPCGSYSYAAPELFTANGHQYNGKKADSWSMWVSTLSYLFYWDLEIYLFCCIFVGVSFFMQWFVDVYHLEMMLKLKKCKHSIDNWRSVGTFQLVGMDTIFPRINY